LAFFEKPKLSPCALVFKIPQVQARCSTEPLEGLWSYEVMALPDSVKRLNDTDIDRVIAMAWEDRTTFDAIYAQFGLRENEVRALMRHHMKASSFKMWRERVDGRKTKHLALRNFSSGRFKSDNQSLG
jgi:uncharacterized protein (TIGR03643 family)